MLDIIRSFQIARTTGPDFANALREGCLESPAVGWSEPFQELILTPTSSKPENHVA